MQRVPEPELMDDAAQARAYAEADFEEPHDAFVDLLRDRLPGLAPSGVALDLGCGPGDVTYRFAAALPGWRVDGIDGSEPMIVLARQDARAEAVGERARFACVRLPEGAPPGARYDLVFSNSLLHHLADPMHLWEAIARNAAPGGRFFVMDLLRPGSRARATELVDQYAAGEPDVLRHDFHASLLAAYRVDEVEAQIARSKLPPAAVEAVSDRHLVAHGALEPSRDGTGGDR